LSDRASTTVPMWPIYPMTSVDASRTFSAPTTWLRASARS